MSERSRRRLPLSPARLNIVELMRLSRQVPLVTAERTMSLAPLADMRKRSAIKVSWSILIMKAFAVVAARRPELRQAFMTYPYKHLYEHPQSICTLIVERESNGERFPLNCRFRGLERESLVELQRKLVHYQTVPLEQDKTFRFMRRLGNMPGLLRRLIWKMGYHYSGSKRAHYFGTFGLSSPAAEGAGLATIVSPLSCTIHYGMFDDADRLPMRITFDHRVTDGAPIARALCEIEQVLLTDLMSELKQMAPSARAA